MNVQDYQDYKHKGNRQIEPVILSPPSTTQSKMKLPYSVILKILFQYINLLLLDCVVHCSLIVIVNGDVCKLM